ncbi:asparagine synthase (glutamine-hydrolyzing) [Hoeflea prorocentri]|uniref:asparagine synthase (glutamine-hydrolyzing) n=1 Tax=Hoeflea prorocentri TaxID=1922333 RepID=A0A9X3UI46_9HYPH|nr:asparagine synthase (glutamine-hydrolyzing) [Hoeflea prorocentri]MCY6381752.1 asparagine synthase (glutamine-hydrolyzing) [Hoeflea prorocentri]MDA5399552.1 asparagine synthase (glutamine-hydrolyzing) [Hoeflea prorocentri]
MCGIAGYFGTPDAPVPTEALLNDMISAVAHRGPDECAVVARPGFGFAHARLSIIDISGGSQPMSNPDGTVWLIFNGEIFNHIELRQELEERGRRFRTKSDTEVILHLYDEKGLDCVEDLNGDFSFAIWDSRRNRLMLARDRMGVRPLFYTEHNGCLFFASEVKSLLTVPGIQAELDPYALDEIFTLWFPLSPRTAFKNVLELPPGHVLTATPSGQLVRPYWQLNFPDAEGDGPFNGRTEADMAEELRALLFDASKIRLRSDVPVGAYLSGGLDSSIITAAVKQITPDTLRTFSVTFESDEFDERDEQQEMVRALGTQHEELTSSLADIGRDFPAVIAHTETPLLRTGPAPLFALSGLVNRAGFKVVLTGEGADEVFAGYDIFKEAKLRRFCAAQPDSRFRTLLYRRLYPYLPKLQNQSQSSLAAFFSAGGASLDDPLYSHLPRFRTTAGTKLFLSRDIRERIGDYDALAALRDSLPADFTRWHPLSQAQYLESSYLLPGYILSSQGDRMSMAHSVEGRYPFLDHRLVEFAANIPPKMKIRALREKHILREAVQDLLPKSIADRPKQPYRAPESQSFAGPCAPAYVDEQLGPEAIEKNGYFDAGAVGKLLAKCRKRPSVGTRDNMALVGIVSTQLWHKEFVDGGQSEVKHGLPHAVAQQQEH